jgi:hypothetical protein
MAAANTVVQNSFPVAPVQSLACTGVVSGINTLTHTLGYAPSYIVVIFKGAATGSCVAWCYDPATLSATRLDIWVSATPTGGLMTVYIG